MLVQNQVGPLATTTSIGAGTQVAGRAGQLGDAIVSELHGRYYEQAYRRNMFFAANSVGVTTTAFTSGTTTAVLGVILSNAPGNSVNLVLNKVGMAFPVINTTVNSGIIALGYNAATAVTHTTALTPRNAFVGVGAVGQGLVDSSSTCPTAPNTSHNIVSMGSAVTLPTFVYFDLEGSIILPPGAYAVITTSAASPASGFQASVMWEEVPV